MRQDADQGFHARGSYRRAMRDEHHLTGAADDGEQFDRRQMSCGVDNHHIGERGGIGQRRECRRRTHKHRLGERHNLRVVV